MRITRSLINLMVLLTIFVLPSSVSASDIDWKQESGKTIKLLFNEHPWTDGVRPYLADFEALTGIKVKLTVMAEDLYMDRMNVAIRSKKSVADVYFAPMDGQGYEQWKAGAMTSLTPFLLGSVK